MVEPLQEKLRFLPNQAENGASRMTLGGVMPK
jgi:hypothetical protein